ncbi:MAG: STAS domain-containing protein [Ruminococcaceae bacterium]|nr:STAS domain-containing protein [Oscillospiraceae bacterium]
MGCYLKIKLRGEIDHHSASSVRTAIDSEIYQKKPRGLIMDMSAVNFMDSSGLGLIMGRYSVMNELGGEVIVTDPNPAIEKIMNLAGMERVIKIKHTKQEAIRATPKVKGRRCTAKKPADK